MESSTFPFPLAVNSSHHSHYHRFLLGADASVLAPFPKPYCVGALAGRFAGLADNLSLSGWRKLYHASFPWVEGFGADHYAMGNVAPHRPLPREYARPQRKFGAYDFVQIADPSVSALALVAGDQRVLSRFLGLGDIFCARLEQGASSRAAGPEGSRRTGQMLAGQFAEPNNRWLMPFLHVHARVLNFTSFTGKPARLTCIDPVALAGAARRAKQDWISRQAEALADLGYRVGVQGKHAPALRIEGVSEKMLAVIEAPRIAVLRVLDRIISGDRPPSAERLCSELPPSVIAAMADRLESILAHSHARFKPAKLGLPSEGPWRGAVRQHLGHCCRDCLETLDRTASAARAVACESAIFSTPALDPAHRHAPSFESLETRPQLPLDPELGATWAGAGSERPSLWLMREFEETLSEVNHRIVRSGPGDPLVSLRHMLATLDQLAEGADPGQLRQAEIFLDGELERRTKGAERACAQDGRAIGSARRALSPLEDLFEGTFHVASVREPEIGGRSL